ELVATVLFMDIRGFTTISEKLQPGELLLWVNRYLETMTDCIMDHGGVVDKYIGDAIMAVFGVPFPRTTTAEMQQDALNAIAASLEMHDRLQQLNQESAAAGKPLIRFGIGVHTGLVVAGSVGGHRRLNYSVLGDTVNIAARLEALNKEIQANNPYDLLVTGETLSCLRHEYHSHLVGTYPLRGRENATLVFSILGKNHP
ncbi:MAG: adenylate/guanylate cyclase domain-containing protein, partial [Leptolyngbyaceae cyanobacterium bins.302]|nr:adenylate/guanylate cyclase domain-containing protein [Leptolyngbyaceae cyanobacterium bins.302]